MSAGFPPPGRSPSFFCSCRPQARADAFSTAWPAPPSVTFGDLYRAVEMAACSRTRKPSPTPLRKSRPPRSWRPDEREKGLPDFDLSAFVDRHFSPPTRHLVAFTPRPGRERPRIYPRHVGHADAQARPGRAVLLAASPAAPLRRARRPVQRDLLLGQLLRDARPRSRTGGLDLARDMLDNIASLIDRYGHVPNGNRSYYLSRSQPPFFSLMVELLAAHDGDAVYVNYLPELEAEYAYWMDGADTFAPGSAARHVVRLPGRDALQPLLGRSGDAARRILSRGRRDGASGPTARRRRSSRSEGRRRERLGFQLALARRRQDACDHPHDRHRPRRSQRRDGSSGGDAREGLPAEGRRGRRASAERPTRTSAPTRSADCLWNGRGRVFRRLSVCASGGLATR